MPLILFFMLGALAIGIASAATMQLTQEQRTAIALQMNKWAAQNISPEENKLVMRVLAMRAKSKGSFYALTYGDVYDSISSVMDAEKWRDLYRQVPELRQIFGPGERPPNQHQVLPREIADVIKANLQAQIGRRTRLRLFTQLTRVFF